jgi:hypothetical protein
MEKLTPSWLSCCSSDFLLSLLGVQQPSKGPSVDSSFSSRTQRVLFTFVAFYTLPRRPLGGVSSPRMFSSSVSSVRPLHMLNASWQSFSEYSVILLLLNSQQSSFLCALLAMAQCPPGRASQNSSKILSELTTEFFQLHLMHMLNAHLAELYRIPSRILSATVFLLHSLASKVFSNLEVFFLFLSC